jgi:hypothetical protein
MDPQNVIWWCVAVVFIVVTTIFIIAIAVGAVSSLYKAFRIWRGSRRQKLTSRDIPIGSAPVCRRCGGSGIEPTYPVENN